MSQNAEKATNPEISEIRARFDKAVGRRQWSMIREKLVPMSALPVVTTGATFSTLLALWDYLPPEAQKIGVLAAGGISAAATAFSLIEAFVRKDKSPLITRSDAIKAMDKDIDQKISPANKMSDKSADLKDSSQKLFELNQKKIWKQWSSQIEDQPFKTGFGPYYKDQAPKAGLHVSILLATAITGAIHGDSAFTKFHDALNWQPPPEPLVYEAWISPPANITQAQGYLPEMIQNAIAQNIAITAHEGSTLFITTQQRQGNITINGTPVEPSERDRNTRLRNTSPEGEIYQYAIPFDGSSETLNIGIEDYNLSITIDIDNPPSVQIDNIIIDEENPSSIEIEYRMEDDYGINHADLETGIKGEDGELRPSRLPSAQIPLRPAPHQTAPEGPGLD